MLPGYGRVLTEDVADLGVLADEVAALLEGDWV